MWRWLGTIDESQWGGVEDREDIFGKVMYNYGTGTKISYYITVELPSQYNTNS